ncbi:MAG: B12-binding domain-containing radical SAM protein [Geitlerinemataceae cyanobacterium]
MNVLLLYPRFPKSFWSFEKTLELLDRKAMLPPLGLITVAALLPQEWNFKLADRNIRDVTEAEWNWADVVILSAMIVQKEDLLYLIREAKRRNKPVAVGGPYPTSIPDDALTAGADYLILDEGEITLPLFVEAIALGETSGTFRSDGVKPDVTSTPIPRFDLLEFDAYSEMSVQFSRGCPFQCEFCDIIVLYGRKPRTKTPEQLLAELDRLYELGWRRSIFMVDDNFIGNKRNVKLFLKELQPWMVEHHYPFSFATEASVDLAKDQELMDSMVACNFGAVFLGIETPDEESLKLTQKFQNTRDSLSESVKSIARSGLRVMAGFIIGFDGEKPGAGRRVVQFVEQTTIPTAIFSMLQALPDTALWHRLEKEGRLRSKSANINQTTLMNFVPTRSIEEIAREFIDAFWELYEPKKFLDRTYRHFLLLGEATYPKKGKSSQKKMNWVAVRALATVAWRQGILRETRWQFWRNLWNLYRCNPGGISSYLGVCAQIEHFLEYRDIVRQEIETQLAAYLAEEAKLEAAKLPVEVAQV